MEEIVVPNKLLFNVVYKVYFDKDSGNITSITNSNETGNYFEIDFESVKSLLSGAERIVDYKVVYDTRKFEYEIVPKNQSIVSIDADDLIYKITTLQQPQISVIQNKKENKWTVEISEQLKSVLEEKGARLEEILFFSITQKDNPNILYRTFSCKICDLIKSKKIDFEYISQEELKDSALSIYTSRKFEYYSHEVINE